MSFRAIRRRCFFCHESCRPANAQCFVCPHCACTNRFHPVTGEILDSEPSMFQERLNMHSFERRASPSTSSLPSISSTTHSPFCHTCRTNQMLLTNLLANYLPDQSSPDYKHRLESLPQYRESLHRRYPPVCGECLPAVEEEIRRKDAMARSQALGSWLTHSKQIAQRRSSISSSKERVRTADVSLLWWRVRGCLWVASLLSTIAFYAQCIIAHDVPSWLPPYLPALIAGSILWAAWDPTYSTIRIARHQGRDVRVQGKTLYVILQMISWASRILTTILLTWTSVKSSADYFICCLVLEICIFLTSIFIIRIRRPPQIKLINTEKHIQDLRSTSPSSQRSDMPAPQHQGVPYEADLFSTLSLSSKPVVSSTPATNPIFGLPSFQPPSTPPPSQRTLHPPDDDAMEWSPTTTTTQSDPFSSKLRSRPHGMNRDADDMEGVTLAPQRFFAPEEPTGLEGLFSGTLLLDSSPTEKDKKWWRW